MVVFPCLMQGWPRPLKVSDGVGAVCFFGVSGTRVLGNFMLPDMIEHPPVTLSYPKYWGKDLTQPTSPPQQGYIGPSHCGDCEQSHDQLWRRRGAHLPNHRWYGGFGGALHTTNSMIPHMLSINTSWVYVKLAPICIFRSWKGSAGILQSCRHVMAFTPVSLGGEFCTNTWWKGRFSGH